MVQKLTLLVLVGILGCLVVIIAQHRGSSGTEIPGTAESQEPIVAEAADPEPAPVIRPVDPVRNAVRTTAPVQPIANPVRANGASPRPVLTAALPIPEMPVVTPPVFVSEPLPIVVTHVAAATSLPFDPSSSLSGRVVFFGNPPPEVAIDMGRPCNQERPGPVTTRHYLISQEDGLANVVVFVESGLENRSFQMPLEPLSLDVTGCLFEPYLLCLMPNQPLRIRNLDSMLHNIHATGRLNKEFNLALAMQGQMNQRTFTTPEMFIRLKCDVHPWEFAYASVMTNPFFAITDKDGLFQFPSGLPAGKYTIAANHLKAGKIRKTISYRPGRSQPLDFQFRQ
jgi:hypothetical protein